MKRLCSVHFQLICSVKPLIRAEYCHDKQSSSDCCYGHLQDLWQTRKPPTALHLADPQLAAVANGSTSSQASGAGPVSACRATGLTDQHKDWSLQENTQVAVAQQHNYFILLLCHADSMLLCG